MNRQVDRNAKRIVLTDAERELAAAYVAAGYVPGYMDIGGYFVRTSKSEEWDRVFVPGPFEPNRRYIAATISDDCEVTINGWIRGDDIVRLGEIDEIATQIGCWIKKKWLKRVVRITGRAAPLPSLASVREAQRNRYILETLAATAFANFLKLPFAASEICEVPLGNVEIAGFLIRATVATDGDEVFLADPLEPHRRYALVGEVNDTRYLIYGWITGKDAIHWGRPSLTEDRGVWLKKTHFRRDFS